VSGPCLLNFRYPSRVFPFVGADLQAGSCFLSERRSRAGSRLRSDSSHFRDLHDRQDAPGELLRYVNSKCFRYTDVVALIDRNSQQVIPTSSIIPIPFVREPTLPSHRPYTLYTAHNGMSSLSGASCVAEQVTRPIADL
jgi:hypothetical protein